MTDCTTSPAGRVAATATRRVAATATRRWIVLAAGFMALWLQLTAQILPPEAMQNAMRLAALTPDEAQSFAGTCLGFGTRSDGQPAKPGNHASCPVCFTLAQTHGFAPVEIDLEVADAWAPLTLSGKPASRPAQSSVAAAFASRAPPASLA